MNEQTFSTRTHNFPEIKAIIFDFGDVLNAPTDYEAVGVHRAKLAGQLGLAPEELWPYLFGGDEAKAWLTGKLSWDDFWRDVLAPKGITDPVEVQEFSDVIFEGTRQLNPNMVELLYELQGNYQLAVLSNASWTEKEMEVMFYNDLGLPAGIFDVVVSSTTVGVAKPDAEIYRYALDRLDILPQEAVFTDDMPTFVEAAVTIGIHARHFSTPEHFREYLAELGVL
jgi:epoxide hydrolase-like predicted phosphatase